MPAYGKARDSKVSQSQPPISTAQNIQTNKTNTKNYQRLQGSSLQNNRKPAHQNMADIEKTPFVRELASSGMCDPTAAPTPTY